MIVPAARVRAFSVVVSSRGFATSAVLAGLVFDRSPEATALIVESMTRDRLGALAAIVIAAVGLAVVLISAGDGRRDHVGEYYALLAAAAAGMVFFVSAENLMTMFLALEWFSISLYVLCALDTHRRESLEAGLKYLIVGSFGSGILLFGCALVYGATGELGFAAIREATGADDPLFVTGMAMILAGLGVQGLGGAVPHVDAGRLPGRADDGDRVHGGRDEGRAALVLTLPASSSPRSPSRPRSGRSRSRCSPSPRSRSATSPRSRRAT